MRGHLAVRIDDGRTVRHVTNATRDLTFRKTAPGGHHSASMRLLLPRDTFSNLGPADKVYVYDARTARTIWEGYTENPGATDGPAGQEWNLSAMGGVVLASDESRPLFYIDKGLEGWELHFQRLAQMTAGSGSRPNEDSITGLLYQFPRGIAVNDQYAVSLRYERLLRADLELGGFRYYVATGINDTNYRTQALTEDDTLVRDRGATGTTVVLVYPSSAGFDFPLGQQAPRIRWIKLTGGATNIANDDTWSHLSDVWVRMVLHNADGSQISGEDAYADGFVYPHQVAADLLGRVLGAACNPIVSTIEETTTAQIDQLAYPDGATAQRILDDLTLHEPDYLWEILDSASGGHRFNYRAWPTTPRYEISVKDGFEAPGGEVDLCNRITVYWTDERGSRQTSIITSVVPELGSRVRDADAITLPEGLGSTANATRVGAQVLEQKSRPPKAARAVVRRPIVDMATRSTVMPWEIEPGYLVRVRETGDDLRLTEMEYADSEGAATLTLGEPQRTIDQLLAGLGRKR